MIKFIRSFFSFGLATTIDKLIIFLLLPIYTRLFTTAEYGVIDLIQMSMGVVAIFGQLQLESSLQRYYYQFKGNLKKIFISTIFIAVTCLSVIVCILIIAFSKQVSLLLFDEPGYSNLIELASLQLPLTNFTMIALVVLRYEKENLKFFLIVLLRVILSLCVVLYLVVYLEMGLEGIFLAGVISFFLSSIPFFFILKRFFSKTFSIRLLRKAFGYGLPQFPARIGSVLLTYANRFFMIGVLSVSSIGIYSLSLKLASSMQLVYSAFIMAWSPFMFKQLRSSAHLQLFPKALVLSSIPAFFLICSLCLFAKEIVLFIASQEFYESYRYIGGLSLFYVLLIFKEIVDIGPKLKEKTKYLSLTFFCALLVNLISLYLLIHAFLLEGVVIAMVLTNTFLLAMSWFVSNRLHPIPYNVPLFIITAIPAYILSVGMLFFEISLFTRILLFIFLGLVYGWGFVATFGKQRVKRLVLKSRG